MATSSREALDQHRHEARDVRFVLTPVLAVDSYASSAATSKPSVISGMLRVQRRNERHELRLRPPRLSNTRIVVVLTRVCPPSSDLQSRAEVAVPSRGHACRASDVWDTS